MQQVALTNHENSWYSKLIFMRAVFLSLRSGNAGCRGYDGIYFKDKVIGGVDMKEDIIDYVLDIRGEP